MSHLYGLRANRLLIFETKSGIHNGFYTTNVHSGIFGFPFGFYLFIYLFIYSLLFYYYYFLPFPVLSSRPRFFTEFLLGSL